MSSNTNRPVGISIIVCCYNSKQRLPQTLKHLAEQELDFGAAVELIIVDNNSSDNTYQFAESEWKRLGAPYPILLLNEERQGQAYARTTGVNAAQFSLIAFVDDDNWLNPDYLRLGFKTMELHDTIAVLGGSNIGVFDSKPPSWIDQPFPFKSLRYSLAIHNEKDLQGSLRDADYVFGAGSIYRVTALDQMYALDFEPLLSGRQKNILTSGDDEELCYALRMLGYLVMRNPEMQLRHYIPDGRLSWPYFKRIYYGYGLLLPIKEMYHAVLSTGSIPETDLKREISRLEVKMKRLEWIQKMTTKLPKQVHLKSDLLLEKVRGRLDLLRNKSDFLISCRKQILEFHGRIKQSQSN